MQVDGETVREMGCRIAPETAVAHRRRRAGHPARRPGSPGSEQAPRPALHHVRMTFAGPASVISPPTASRS
ncbi:hypothetical protein HBB16_18865 [Pseudonocardia sp. MCCB 268]|nr:hypothetical protein [Pseudonocardia cytotoxica]